MTSFARILTGAAGIAMVAGGASPAMAQTSNYSGYQGYNQGYANQGGGVVGSVINSILGGGRYGAYGQGPNARAVDQCARTAEAQVSRDYRSTGGYGQYPQGYNDPRYGNQPYAQQGYGQQGYNRASIARVIGITAVERRPNGLKVSGVIDSGMNRYRGAYGNQGYNQTYPNAGYPNQGYNPNQAYPNQAYPNQGYPNQGYANPYGNAYGQQAQVADLRFSCRVDTRGYVSNVDIRRNVAPRRGY